MNSYLEKEKRKLASLNILNPLAKEYDSTSWKISSSKPTKLDMGPKQAERQYAFNEDAYVQNQHYLGTSHGLITGGMGWESQQENHH